MLGRSKLNVTASFGLGMSNAREMQGNKIQEHPTPSLPFNIFGYSYSLKHMHNHTCNYWSNSMSSSYRGRNC